MKFSKSFAVLAVLAAGCTIPVGESFTSFVNEDGAGSVFEGVIEITESVRHFRQVEGSAAEERVAIDIGGPKTTETEQSSSKANRVETVTEVAELENGTRVYTEVKTIATEQTEVFTTVVDGEFGYTDVDTQTGTNFQEVQAINRWDGTDGSGIINIETLGGLDYLTLFMGRVAILAGAAEGDAWDDAFDDYDDMYYFAEQAHVYSVEEVGDGDATNGDGDEADSLTVKIRFASPFWADEPIAVGSTQALDDLVNACLQVVQRNVNTNYVEATAEDDNITANLVQDAQCPPVINEATLTVVEDVITSAELSYVRVGFDEGTVQVARNEDPNDTTNPTVTVFDPGFGYELIINCDNDGDSDPLFGYLNPTDDVQCRFISDSNYGSVTVGSASVDFENNQSQLKKYVHYNVTEGTVKYTLSSWTNPEQ